MIGSLPRYAQAPLDYRYALDAAMPLLARANSVAVTCRIPVLSAEIGQRVSSVSPKGQASAGLWVEPLVDTWQADLVDLAGRLHAGSPLIVVASQPLARIIAERQSWPGTALGLQPGSLRKLRRALSQSGFRIEQRHGIHSLGAILFNQIGQQLAGRRRPDLSDRMEFAARLRYRIGPPWTAFATVSLWLARRQA